MVLVLALAFLVVPFVELYVIVQTSHAIGFLNTLGVLVLVSIIGAWLVKRQGVRVWTRFNQAVQANQVPSKEIAEGVCLLLAGALMITPGFVTDVVGILLLLPPTQALFRATVLRRWSGRGRVVRATYRGGVYDTSAHDPSTEPPRGELDP